MEPKLYEIAYFIDSASEEKTAEVSSGVRKFLEDKKAVITSASVPQKKRLAYPIRKKNEGVFLSFKFLMHPENIAELTEFLGHGSSILRYHLAGAARLEEASRPSRAPKPRRAEEKHADDASIDKKLEEILGK